MKSNIATSIAVLMAAALTSGVALPTNQNALVAHAGTLQPQPIPPAAPAVIVEERVVRADSPVSSPQKPARGLENEATASFSSFLPGIIAGSNCVVCVRAMVGSAQNGNAGTWSSNDSHPDPGDVMIFRAGQQGASGMGHVGVVAWTDGRKVKLRHCNWGGGQIEFYSTGLFWRP